MALSRPSGKTATATAPRRVLAGAAAAGITALGLSLALGTAQAADAATVTARPAVTVFGNAAGAFPVPAAAAAVNTSQPTQVIGTGTPASCTSAAVVRAVAAGGIITFSCGPAPVTILMTATATVASTAHTVVIDGGGLVTLNAANGQRILFSDTCNGTWTTDDCVSQPYPQVTVQNITLENGNDQAPQATCTANAPQCWYGGISGGGAIYDEGGQFKAVNDRFLDNHCTQDGPDLGGGALRILAQYQNSPVYITSDTFTGNYCSNGGALSSIDTQWDILNSAFTYNHAIGWGANPAASGTPGGGSGGAIYNDGNSYSTLIAGTTMTDNTATEGGGGIFYVVDNGTGQLTLNQSHLTTNKSGEFQTAPGIYDRVDTTDGPPAMINSTDS